MTEHRYRNPWAKSYDPQEYVRLCPDPVEYAGCLLYHVFPAQWDTVKAGVCIAQRVSIDGAKHAADIVADIPFPSYADVWERRSAEIGE